MQASLDRTEFLPPRQPGRWRAVVLAVSAHLILLGALTLGLRWNDETTLETAEAELWSATAQQAAPKLVEAPPPPPPPPQPQPRVEPPPPPPVPKKDDADIAVEREKKRQAEEKQRQERAERERLAKLEAEKEKREKAEREKAEARRKELAEQKRREEERKRELAEKAEKEKAREAQEAKRLAQLREENMRRIQGLAGATGGPSATGTALRSSGPSDSYAGRIRARVKPNIVFADDVPGNPTAEVEVRMAPDGTITSRKITKSSGVKSWDEAVLRALDRTEVLPRDVDGRVHSPLLMQFRPKG